MEIAREIVPANLADEMRKSYLDYAMSVIVGRALPDVRDGLKPVHRRVLHAMRELGNDYNKAYKKSARVVGDVIGKYHPHGDTAVYDTIVRMAQHFSMRYVLVDGQGNFGSVDGDAPAAMRYTEVHGRAGTQLLAIDKETVDFVANYTNLNRTVGNADPRPQPAVNGSSGIVVGMATNICRTIHRNRYRRLLGPAITPGRLMQKWAPIFPERHHQRRAGNCHGVQERAPIHTRATIEVPTPRPVARPSSSRSRLIRSARPD